MGEFLIDNLGTIIICLVLIGIVAGIIAKLFNDKKKGKCMGCECGCTIKKV